MIGNNPNNEGAPVLAPQVVGACLLEASTFLGVYRERLQNETIGDEGIARRWLAVSSAVKAGLLSPADVGPMLLAETGIPWAESVWTYHGGKGTSAGDGKNVGMALNLAQRSVALYAKTPARLVLDYRKAFGGSR